MTPKSRKSMATRLICSKHWRSESSSSNHRIYMVLPYLSLDNSFSCDPKIYYIKYHIVLLLFLLDLVKCILHADSLFMEDYFCF